MSVIPIQPKGKKPLIKWEKHQKEKAEPETIKTWARQWPDMNIAIVTGKISNLTVVDVDSLKGEAALNALLPDSLTTPIALTPSGGEHFFFRHHAGLGNATRFITDTDLRGNGGYVVAPPSVGANGKPYSWVDGASIFEVDSCELPASLYKKISSYSSTYMRGDHTDYTPQDHKRPQMTTNVHIRFEQGYRDNSLFHIANCLFKGGMPVDEIQQFLSLIAEKLCYPPFPQREVGAKIKSVVKRIRDKDRNIASEVRDLIMTTSGHVSTTNVHTWLQLTTRREKKTAQMVLARMEKEGLIEKTGRRAGEYRIIDNQADEIDFLNASNEPFPILWPFRLEEYASLYSKNIAVIAGAPNAGKTALVLNLAAMNLSRYKGRIRYISSEMGATELKTRLQKFKIPLEDWQGVDFREKAGNFSDVLMPDWINIVDFYEISSDFWKIAEDLKRIYQKLNKGIAVVCLQKSPGKDQGRGGDFGLEKPRLYLNLDTNPPDGAVLEIRKGKNWAKEGRNPNRYKTHFKILDGAKLIQQGDWFLELR